jgi:DNA-binding NtrC family response regulator
VCNVLIVDDDIEVVDSLKKGLERVGYSCTGVSTGERALQIYKKERFDIVLTDIQMAEMDGVELIKHLYQYDKNVRIIIITVLQDFEVIGRKYLENVYAYFDKPIDFFKLVEQIENIEGQLVC